MGRAGATACRLRVPAPSTTQYVISGGSSALKQPHQPCLRAAAAKRLATPSILAAAGVAAAVGVGVAAVSSDEELPVLLTPLSEVEEAAEVDFLKGIVVENCAWRVESFLANSALGRAAPGGCGWWLLWRVRGRVRVGRAVLNTCKKRERRVRWRRRDFRLIWCHYPPSLPRYVLVPDNLLPVLPLMPQSRFYGSSRNEWTLNFKDEERKSSWTLPCNESFLASWIKSFSTFNCKKNFFSLSLLVWEILPLFYWPADASVECIFKVFSDFPYRSNNSSWPDCNPDTRMEKNGN